MSRWVKLRDVWAKQVQYAAGQDQILSVRFVPMVRCMENGCDTAVAQIEAPSYCPQHREVHLDDEIDVDSLVA